jgi:uncharacterized protein YceK
LIQQSKFSIIATAIAAVAMCMSGCSSSQKQIGPKNAANWAYAPNTIALHNLSRIRSGEDMPEAKLILHIAFLDGDGFACRGIGELQIEIVSASGKSTDTKRFDLRNEVTNRDLFDAVTRTYRIEFDTLASVESVNVRASFYADGDVLHSNQKRLVNFAKVNEEE